MGRVDSIVPEPSTVGFEANGRNFPSSIPLDRWRDGISFIQSSCMPAKGWWNTKSVSCDRLDYTAEVELKEFHEPLSVSFFPFPIYWGAECGGDDTVVEDFRNDGVTSLNVSRSSVFAQEISEGKLSGSPSFRTHAIPLNDEAVDLSIAFSWLLNERVKSGVGGRHKIHIPALFAPQAHRLNLFSTNFYDLSYDNYVTNWTPTNVIPGGDVPSAPAADEGWVVITGIYEYDFARETVVSGDALDAKKGNVSIVRAEQQGIFRFDVCNVFAVKVKLIGC